MSSSDDKEVKASVTLDCALREFWEGDARINQLQSKLAQVLAIDGALGAGYLSLLQSATLGSSSNMSLFLFIITLAMLGISVIICLVAMWMRTYESISLDDVINQIDNDQEPWSFVRKIAISYNKFLQHNATVSRGMGILFHWSLGLSIAAVTAILIRVGLLVIN
jgi:hypothetical protein